MKTEIPKENAQTNCDQEQHDKIVAVWPTTKVPVKHRKSTREMVLEDALTYHIPMEVTRILKYPSGDCYPICPRCLMPIDREYMSFCDRCGQKLGWKKLKDAVFVYPGYRAATKKDKKRDLSLF